MFFIGVEDGVERYCDVCSFFCDGDEGGDAVGVCEFSTGCDEGGYDVFSVVSEDVSVRVL